MAPYKRNTELFSGIDRQCDHQRGNRGVKTLKAPGYRALSTEQPGEWRVVERSSSYQGQNPRL
jgi:hypothetical protein